MLIKSPSVYDELVPAHIFQPFPCFTTSISNEIAKIADKFYSNKPILQQKCENATIDVNLNP